MVLKQMEGRKLKTMLGLSLAANVLLVIFSTAIGTIAYLGGVATCVYSTVEQVNETVEGVKNLPEELGNSVEGTIKELPIPGQND